MPVALSSGFYQSIYTMSILRQSLSYLSSPLSSSTASTAVSSGDTSFHSFDPAKSSRTSDSEDESSSELFSSPFVPTDFTALCPLQIPSWGRSEMLQVWYKGVRFRVSLACFTDRSQFCTIHIQKNSIIAPDGDYVWTVDSVLDDGISTWELEKFIQTVAKFDFYYEDVSSSSFPRHAAVYRVATSLEFPNLQKWAKKGLETYWSSDIDKTEYRLSKEAACDAIILANAYSMTSVLKRAQYELTRMQDYWMIPNSDPENHLTLVELISNAREGLTSAWLDLEIPSRWRSAKCRRKQCICSMDLKTVKAVWYDAVVDSKLCKQYEFDPIAGFAALSAVPWELHGICHRCADIARRKWASERQELWDQLDDWFCLAGDDIEEGNTTML